MSRDPKPSFSESPYTSMGNNPIFNNDVVGDTIRNAKIADYQGKTPKYHHSRTGFDLYSKDQKSIYTITPYYDKNEKIVAYAAGRLNLGNEYAIEYYLDKGDFADFSKNLDNYKAASNLFMMNGTPSDGNLAFMSGLANHSFSETLGGLKKLWGEALHDPVWVTSTILMIGDGAIRSMPAGPNSATRLANRAQNLRGSVRPSVVAVFEPAEGAGITVGRNKGGVVNAQTQAEVIEAGVNQYHGQCAEINAISRARNNGVNVEGGTISVKNVRGKTSSNHATNKAPCSTCAEVIRRNNIKVVN
jgi:hypothetical protein